jgi:HEAT repeat protein
MRIHSQHCPRRICSALLLGLALFISNTPAAEKTTGPVPKYKEADLIKVLQSNAAPEEKAITCKRLAVWGTKEAVPALARLLPDEKLTSWARIALEAIPGSAADKALRDAVPKVKGKVLVGVINSIGVRRDSGAVSLLGRKLNDQDTTVASAAAESLGRIGGSRAARALQAHLKVPAEPVRSAVAEGCVRCAEQFMSAGDYSRATRLYDLVRNADVPQERTLEATRGAILARRSEGMPMLLTELRSSDKALMNIGLQTARELPGPAVTSGLADEMQHSSPERQPLILLAIAERGDPTAFPIVVEAARSGSNPVRLVAIKLLDRFGKAESLPTLLELASSGDSELSKPAKEALGRLPGGGVDQEILTRLSGSDESSRPVLLEIAGRRAMENALPVLLKFANSSDGKTRNAALGAIGTIGGDREAAALVKLVEQQQQTDDKRGDTEKALLAVSSRRGASCAPILLPLSKSENPSLRIIGIRALAASGGPQALDAVKNGTEDDNEQVREEAVQTLTSWPNTWPEDSQVAEPLLALAKSSKKPEHQILAVRGFLQLLLNDDKLKADDKLQRLNQVLPLLERPEDKKLAIAVIRQIPKSDALDLLSKYAEEPAVADDACSAIIDVAGQPKSKLAKEARQQALQVAANKSGNDELKQKAQNALQKLN